MHDLALQFKGNALAELFLRFPCPQKILMVTDGGLDFGSGGFGLSEFVGLIKAAGHSVATAHRSGAGPNLSIAGNFDFAAAATAVTVANYDQVWMFGIATGASPITPAEQSTLAQFMKKGGGVFATGDHETLGAGMGANLPRVRGMRNWASIPMVDPERHDTVIDPGADNVKQFNDQADATPQRLYPMFFSNGGPSNVAATWAPHPVLRHPSGAVDALPDHPHESECLEPVPFAGNFAGVEEWPAPVGGGARIRASVAAVSISAGRFITDTLKPPVRPHSFGAISTYDGDAALVGRIVCDATWHHFVNINLNGSGAGLDPSTGLPRSGLYVGGVATAEYAKIKSYYLNTVRWLAPRGRRNCWPFLQVALARVDFEMRELRLPEPHPCPWDPLLRIGGLAEQILTRHWGPGAAAEIVDGLVNSDAATPTLGRVLKAQQFNDSDDGDKPAEPSLLPLQDMRRAVLGSLVNLIAIKLPTDEARLAALLKDGHDKLAKELSAEAISAAEATLGDHLQRALKQTSALAKAIAARK